MSYTLPLKELSDTQRVRKMCIGNSDPIFIAGDDGNGEMVLLDATLFRELYAKHQIYKKLEEGERAIAEGRVQNAFEALEEVWGGVHV